METDARRQRRQFYRDYASGQWSMSELCDRYQISRPTGYKWVVLALPRLRNVDRRLSAFAEQGQTVGKERHPRLYRSSQLRRLHRMVFVQIRRSL